MACTGGLAGQIGYANSRDMYGIYVFYSQDFWIGPEEAAPLYYD